MMYGRNIRQLLVTWGIALLFLVGLYRLELTIPALHEILLPVYWAVFATAGFFTWRWVRGRGRGDRRGGDRRMEERRTDPPVEPGS
jgi:hypothetical protein